MPQNSNNSPPPLLPALFCPYCARGILFQRIYTAYQAAYLLGISAEQLRELVLKKKLKARLQLVPEKGHRWIYDYFHLDEFIRQNYPTHDELTSESPHLAIRMITRLEKRIKEHQRKMWKKNRIPRRRRSSWAAPPLRGR